MAEDIIGSVEDAGMGEVLDRNFSDNSNANELFQKFQQLVQNEELLNNASAYLLDELLSDAIFGVFLEVHHLRKTGNLVALDGHPENCDNFEHNSTNNNNNNNSSSSSNSLNTSATILPLNSSLHANTANTCSSSSSSSSSSSTTNSNSNSSGGGNGGSGGSGSGVCSTVPTNLTMTTTTATAATTSSTSTSTSSLRIVDLPNYDIFGMSTAKKPIDCTCPNCDRLVSAARFAPHLEKCMGMGRLSSRIASRRLATKEVNSNSSSSLSANSLNSTSTLTLAATYLQTGIPTDDEDDIEWSSSSFEKRRKKINQNTRNNGTKKNNGKTC